MWNTWDEQFTGKKKEEKGGEELEKKGGRLWGQKRYLKNTRDLAKQSWAVFGDEQMNRFLPPGLLNFLGGPSVFFLFLSPQPAADDATWASLEPSSFPPFFFWPTDCFLWIFFENDVERLFIRGRYFKKGQDTVNRSAGHTTAHCNDHRGVRLLTSSALQPVASVLVSRRTSDGRAFKNAKMAILRLFLPRATFLRS